MAQLFHTSNSQLLSSGITIYSMPLLTPNLLDILPSTLYLSNIRLHTMQLSSTPISNSSYSSTPKSLPTEIVQAYGGWIQQHLNLGWDGYLVTFMFRNISGSNEVKI